MTEVTHTPGPWGITGIVPTGCTVEAKERRYPHRVGQATRMRTATVALCWSTDDDGGISDDEARANACLIAAAPEMLAALQKVSETRDMTPAGETAMTVAGAIDKALGHEPPTLQEAWDNMVARFSAAMEKDQQR